MNLPYEDRKSFMVSTAHRPENNMRESVRFSMMSQRQDPNRGNFLNPNRKRLGSGTRDDYERQMQLSKRGGNGTKSVRGEQMSIMSEPRGAVRGLKGLSPTRDEPNRKQPSRHISNQIVGEQPGSRLNIPPLNIAIGVLDDISSRGSNRNSMRKGEESKDSGTAQANPPKAKAKTMVTFQEPSDDLAPSRSQPQDQSNEDNSKETGSELKDEGKFKNELNPESKPQNEPETKPDSKPDETSNEA